MKKAHVFAPLFLTLAMASAHASVYVETTDTGELVNSAQILPGGTTAVQGRISPSDILDLYGFDIAQQGSVQINFIPSPYGSDEWFDSDITLFNAAGNPVLVTDNEIFSYDFAPGRYYIAISDWNIAAIGTSGQIIADDYYGVLDTSGTLSGWTITSSPFRYGAYELRFSVPTAAVPEPGTGLMMLTAGALAALGQSLRRRTSQA